jgi:hypothetical protein
VSAPERIWTWEDDLPEGPIERWWATSFLRGATEYLRADIHEAEVARLRDALDGILHVGHDAPATFAGDEADWQARRARHMQSIARAALGDNA